MRLFKYLMLGILILTALGSWIRYGPGGRVLGITPEAVRVVGNSIEVPAVVRARSFDPDASEMGGYHLVVWDRGRAASAALFRSAASDREVLDALEGLGGEPGNALPIAAWDDRENPDSTAPDQVIQGQRVEILVRLPGSAEALGLEKILYDPGTRGFGMRLGGHRDNIPKWRSGCVVCLYSCPGSKVGNDAYTVRDFVAGRTRFAVRPGVLPRDGTDVTLIFKLVPDELI